MIQTYGNVDEMIMCAVMFILKDVMQE